MPMSYQDWQDREAGHGTDSHAEDDLYDVYNLAIKAFIQDEDRPPNYDYYFLETPHRASIYVKTREGNAELLGEQMTRWMHDLDYDRIDQEIFGPENLILTVPDTKKNED